MQKKTILWLTSSYPRFEKDSASIFLRSLAKSINQHYFNLHILSPDDSQITAKNNHDAITHHHFKYFLPRSYQKLAYGSGILPNLKQNPVLFMQVPGFLCSQFISCLIIAYRIKPELIHAHWVFPQGCIAAFIGKLLNIPVIMTAHGGDAFSLSGKILSSIKRWALNHCSAWTSNTNTTAYALGDYLQPPHIIPMGINYEQFNKGDQKELRSSIPDTTYIVLFVGRLVEKKGVSDLITALSMLNKTDKNSCLLWIIGDGNEKINLEKQVEHHQLHNVTFFGKLPNIELPDYYAAADIFIAPSIVDSKQDTEGQGVMLLEAMASGTPIISTQTGGITEIIEHDYNGILVKPNQPKQIKTALENLLMDRNKREYLSANAKQTAKKYDWSIVAKQFIKLYESVIVSK